MIEDSHLHLLINEELYIIPEKQAEESEEITKEEISEVEETANKVEASEPVIVEDQSSNAQLLIAIENINDSEKEFLSKIMAALELKESDYKISIGSTKEIPNFPRAILFTKNPKFPLYEIYNFRKTELMTCLSLSELMQSQQEKKRLWDALKSWYNIS